MKEDKLFNYFRDHDDAFDEKPNDVVWSKLQSKLQSPKSIGFKKERRKRKHNLLVIRTISIAASFVGILVLAGYLFTNSSSHKVNSYGKVLVVEVLEFSETADSYDVQTAKQVNYKNTIKEGEKGKKLFHKSVLVQKQKKLIYHDNQ